MSQIADAETAGTLDLSFGDGGLCELPDMTRSMAALPNGKLMVVTGSNHQLKFTVARFTEAGELDKSFGEGGEVELPIRGRGMFPRRIVALNSGKYLISAYQTGVETPEKYLIRLLEDGRMDTSFGVDGIATLNIADVTGASLGRRVRFPNDKEKEGNVEGTFFSQEWLVFSEQHAKIFISSNIATDLGIEAIVFRLNEDGSLDTTFNGGYALVKSPVEGANIRLGSLAIHGEGVLLGATIHPVGGYLGDAFVIRYDQSGNVDTSFGKSGTVIIPNFTDDRKSIITSIVVSANGPIVASGESKKGDANEGLIIVLNPNGSFNRIFNQGKPLYSDSLSGFLLDVSFSTCILQQDMKIIVTGPGEGGYLAAARFDLEGSLDKTFGGKGWVVFHAIGAVGVRSSELTVDNKIVVLGIKNSAVRYFG